MNSMTIFVAFQFPEHSTGILTEYCTQPSGNHQQTSQTVNAYSGHTLSLNRQIQDPFEKLNDLESIDPNDLLKPQSMVFENTPLQFVKEIKDGSFATDHMKPAFAHERMDGETSQCNLRVTFPCNKIRGSKILLVRNSKMYTGV